MDRFCIIANKSKDERLAFAKRVSNFIEEHGKSCYVAESGEELENGSFTDAREIPEGTQCAIVLGGDGTIIRAATDLAPRNIAILGINLGTLGFLAETERHNAFGAIEKVFEDQCRIEARMMLSASIYSREKSGGFPEAEPVFEGLALNDVVVTRSGFSRLICAEVYINGELLSEYRGDGVIISTPTGSTGYNLSAGGPIVMPGAELMLITPICPHSMNAKGIVISAGDEVAVLIKESKKTQAEEAFATYDGKEAIRLKPGDLLRVRRSELTAKLVRMQDRGFFDILRSKL